MTLSETQRKIAARISQGSFWLGSLVAVTALIRTWWLNRDLPDGVCPIDNNRPLLYVALGLLGLSLLTDLLFPRTKKEAGPALSQKEVPALVHQEEDGQDKR